MNADDVSTGPGAAVVDTDDRRPVLTAAGLHKTFGVTPALRGADLAVSPGEIVAVLGPSGSGKSTLLHCAAGILRPDAGEVAFQGTDLASLDDREVSELRRLQFGFVFQFGQLLPELTCLDNAALPLRLQGVGRRPATAAAREWLGRLDVSSVADQYPGQVSGGQAQRVAVARALIGDPAVIFADEPTGALDTMHGERVMEMLVGAVEQINAALVLVTHEPRVAAYSDREVVVRDGRTAPARS